MIRVLIVDDKEENLYLLRALLQGNGYEVVTSPNGADALDKARQDHPDLIIADILMPVMDGFALCREWKKDSGLKSIPFIFYTATYTDERDRDFALSLGAERFIVKPEEPEAFMAIVCETLKQAQNPAQTASGPQADTPGRLAVKSPEEEEAVFLKQYNEALIGKLESKMQQLDRANRELEESLRIKDRLIESAVNPIVMADMKDRLLFVNKGFLATWGYKSTDEVMGRPVSEFWSMSSDVGQSLRTKGNWVGRCAGAGRDGQRLEFQLSASLVRDGDQNPLCLGYSFVDMTEVSQLRRRLKTEQSFAGIVGRDPKMLEVFDAITEVARVDVPVLLQGESGTGKELVAAAIHTEGSRADKPFIAVNCGALPEGILESELFGHVRGAFTGAASDRKGRFELADGGTIFLDEAADIPPAMQVKLLRVLQDGSFVRVGDEQTTRVNVRVISASNKDLSKAVAAGKFREDLFYRLAVVPIALPPLRERTGDIPLLAEHLLRKSLAKVSRHVTLSPESLAAMMDYRWPGNVRELENAIHYALVRCRGDVLCVEHLPPLIRKAGPSADPAAGKQARAHKLNSEAVRSALASTKGNKKDAARELGVSRATLYRFLAESGQGDAR